MIRHLTLSALPASSMAFAIASYIASVSPFFFSGRFIRILRTGPSLLMKTSGIHCFSVEQMSQKSGGFRRAQPPADAYPQRGSIGMARSYYSTIFEQSADEIWNVIRDFNNYPVLY